MSNAFAVIIISLALFVLFGGAMILGLAMRPKKYTTARVRMARLRYILYRLNKKEPD